MVAQAQRSRASIQRLADQVAGWFVPPVISVAVFAFAAWAAFGPEPRFTFAMIAAVSGLIMPARARSGSRRRCRSWSASARARAPGVLIKNAKAERLEKVDTLVVDMIGALTEGKPRVAAVVPAAGFASDEILRLAASLERWSEHPLASAILAAARERSLALADVVDFDAPPAPYPFFGLTLSPVIAAAAMALSSGSVIANSLRLRRVKL